MTYNGHKNWNHWNVNLWLTNDEELFDSMRHCMRYAGNRDDAAGLMLDALHEAGMFKTPDGAPYTVSSIRAAMRDWRK